MTLKDLSLADLQAVKSCLTERLFDTYDSMSKEGIELLRSKIKEVEYEITTKVNSIDYFSNPKDNKMGWNHVEIEQPILTNPVGEAYQYSEPVLLKRGAKAIHNGKFVCDYAIGRYLLKRLADGADYYVWEILYSENSNWEAILHDLSAFPEWKYIEN